MSATGQRGTYNLTRELWDHPIFAKEPFTEAQAWAWMIGQASFRETKVATVAAVSLSRGELCLGENRMAERWGWSRSRVHRFLEKLRKAGMIEVRENGTEQRTRNLRNITPNIIKISNYRRFQDPVNRRTNTTSTDSRTAYKEESKNPVRTTPSLRSGVSRASEPALPGFEADNPKSKPQTPHPIPDDFIPDPAPAIAYWRKRGREDLVHLADEEAVTFRAHHRKLGSKFKDWPAAWRTWYVVTPERIRPPPHFVASTAIRPPQGKIITLAEVDDSREARRVTH